MMLVLFRAICLLSMLASLIIGFSLRGGHGLSIEEQVLWVAFSGVWSFISLLWTLRR